MITSVTVENIKGRSFQIELEPVTRIIGPNASGKTAIADAITIGLIGYSPRMGKRPGDTMQLCSANELMVSLGFSGGDSVTRTFNRGKGGKVTVESSHENPLTQPMMLDIKEWFGMTKQQRAEFVNSTASAGFTFDHVISAFDQSTVTLDPQKHLEFMDQARAILKDLIDSAPEEQATPNEVIEAALLQFANRSDTAAATVTRCSGVVQAHHQLKDENTPAPQDRSVELEQIRQRIATLQGESRRRQEMLELCNQRDREVRRTESKLEDLRKQLPEAGQILEMRKYAEDREHERQRRIQEGLPEQSVFDQAIEKEWERTRDAVKKLESEAATLSERRRKLLEELGEAQAIMASGKGCPHCGATQDHWSEERNPSSFIAKLEGELSKIAARSRSMVQEEKALQEAVEKAIKARNDEIARTTAESKAAAEDGRVRGELAIVDKVTKWIGEAGAELKDRKQEHVKALEQWHALLTELGPTDSFQHKLEEAGATLARLDAETRRFLMERGKLQQMAKASEELEKAKLEDEAFKAFIKGLKKFRATQAQIGMQKFCETIERFTFGITLIGGKIQFDGDEIGYRNEKGVWVPHEAMSGSEQALVYIGLGVAAAAKQSDHKIVILDEMGIIDPRAETLLWERMKELVEEKIIDQFIGISTTELGIAQPATIDTRRSL